MTIPSQFASFLAVAERDGEGGLKAEPPAIILGEACAWTISLPTHPDYGDWTAGAFTAVLRAGPGAGGDPLATYSCSTGAPAGGSTPVTLTLLAADQDGLPSADPATGLSEVFLSVRFTKTGGTIDTIITTRQLVRGAI